PLSVATSLLAESGVDHILGVCELPLVTARAAAETAGVRWEDVEWDYEGLNHRGFVTRLTAGARDLIAELASLSPSTEVAGVRVAFIQETGAVPMKYFELFHTRVPASYQRGRRVERIRERTVTQLRATPEVFPEALRERRMDWYPLVVVPLLSALASELPEDHVVNVGGPDGVTRETRAMVCRSRVEARPRSVGNSRVASWLERFERHERAVLAALADPSTASVTRALELDPLVRRSDLGSVAARLVDEATGAGGSART